MLAMGRLAVVVKGNRGKITLGYMDELMMINAPVIERADGEVWKTAN